MCVLTVHKSGLCFPGIPKVAFLFFVIFSISRLPFQLSFAPLAGSAALTLHVFRNLQFSFRFWFVARSRVVGTDTLRDFSFLRSRLVSWPNMRSILGTWGVCLARSPDSALLSCPAAIDASTPTCYRGAVDSLGLLAPWWLCRSAPMHYDCWIFLVEGNF